MFTFIVIGSGLIGLGTILLTITHGAGMIGIDLIIFMDGIVLIDLGIMLYGVQTTITTMLLSLTVEEGVT
jgi:hypothetical protein